MKTCTRCGEHKPPEGFQIRNASKDGLTASCKECLKTYDRMRANLPHRVKARMDYQKTTSGMKASSKAKRDFALRNPHKRTAHIKVGNALRSGRLSRPDYCESCKQQCRPEAHHCDYGKPLEVQWLCKACHVKWHKYHKPIIPIPTLTK